MVVSRFGRQKSVLSSKTAPEGWALSLLYAHRYMAGTLFKKVLVPVDFSACSDEAFRVALQLADAVDADVTVMHVIDVNAVDAFNRLGLLAVPSDATQQRKRLRHHARLRMRQLLKSPSDGRSI